MFNLFNQAFAETPLTKSGGFGSFLPLILITVVFYFLVIRPQQKKNREHQDKLKNLTRDDEVITTGGIIGTVTQISPESDNINLEIAKGVEIKVHKLYIADFIPKVEGEKKEKSKKKSQK